jgi:hypothetical protein
MGLPKRTHEQFVSEVKQAVGDEYTVLGQYVNTDTPIMVRHNNVTCQNHEYEVRPFKFLKGQRCGHPNCKGPRQRIAWHAAVDMSKFLTPPKLAATFREEVYAVVGDEYVFLDEYTTGRDKLRVRHNSPSCGHEYTVRPDTFLSGGRRCPRCARLALWHGGSRASRRIEEWLSSNGYMYRREVTYDGLVSISQRPLYFDFAIQLNDGELLMEFDGIQHVRGWMGNHDKLPVYRENDQRKDSFCRTNGIMLVRLTYRTERYLEEILQQILTHVKGSTTIPEGSTPQAIGGGNGRDPMWVLI